MKLVIQILVFVVLIKVSGYDYHTGYISSSLSS